MLSLPTSYRMLERQQIIICGILVAGHDHRHGAGAARSARRAARASSRSATFPHVPPSAPAEFRQNALPLIAVTFGYVGGSVMTYLVYPDFISLHGWGMTGHPQIDEIRRRAAAGKPADYLPTDPAAVAAGAPRRGADALGRRLRRRGAADRDRVVHDGRRRGAVSAARGGRGSSARSTAGIC